MTASLKLTSPVTQAAAPFVVGQGFKKGDVPAGQYVVTDLANSAVQVLSTWNDGSVKHARIMGRASLTVNVPLTVNLSTSGTAPSGTNLTAAYIASLSPSASVQCGSLGTVTLASLLGSPLRTWTSTPEMVECIYRADVVGTLLTVWFHVKAFIGGAVKVRAAVENGYLDNGAGAVAVNADASYIPTVTIGGTVIYDNGGAALTHCKNTRWSKTAWIGTDPQITPQHDGAYSRASKLVPNYSGSPSTAMLDSYTTAFVPMSTGGIPAGMANGGANPTIALLPEWDASYVLTGDPRAYRAAITASDSLGSFGICWRDFTTKDVIKPSAFPTWSIYGPGESNDRYVNSSNGASWEINHHPGIGYTAYLYTGEYWHYETMLLQVSLLWAIRGIMSINDPAHGSGTSRVIAAETRGGSWSARSLNQLCGLMPDSEKTDGKVGAEYRTLLANSHIYWKSLIDTSNMSQLGYLYEYSPGGVIGPYGPGKVSPWQQFWWIQADGFGSDLEPLADMTTFNAVRDFRYKAVVGMIGDVNTGFAFDCASVYSIKISASSNADPTTWYSDWRTVFNDSFAPANNGDGVASIPHTNTLLNAGDLGSSDTSVPTTSGAGGPADASSGRWGYLLPALSYAAEHGAPGAAAAWARVTGATNYSALTGAFANQSSQWGVFPRSIGAPAVTITGPTLTLSASRLYAGKLVFNKYRGWGTPLSGVVASGGSDGDSPARGLIDNGDVMTNELRPDVTVAPAHGTIDIAPDLSILYAGDGTPDSFTVQWYYCGAALGSPVVYTLGSGTVTISCAPGTAAALGLIAVVSGSAPNGTIQAGVGSFVAVGATATITNLAPSVVTIACHAGDATMGGPGCVIINGTASITVAPARVLMGDGLNQPDLDGTFVMREGRPTIDTDPDDNLFYGVDLADELGVSSASLVSVTAIPGGAAACLPAFIQDTRVIAKVRVPGVIDDCALHFVTFRAVNTLGEQSDHTIYFRMVNK